MGGMAISVDPGLLAQGLWTTTSGWLWAGDSGGRCVAANPALCESTGYSQDELRSMDFSGLMADASRFETLYDAVWSGAQPTFLLSGKLRAKDGRESAVKVTAVRAATGEQSLVLCTITPA